MLAMDTSRSMVATDVPPTRLAVAKDAVRRFLQELPDDYRVGMNLLAQSAQTVLPATANRDAALAPATCAPEMAPPSARESPGCGRSRNGCRPRRASWPPAAVLSSSPTAADPGRAQAAAGRPAAAKLKIPVHTVAFGTADGVVEVKDDNVHAAGDGPA